MKSLFLLICDFAVLTAFSQPSINWEQNYGGSADDEGRAIAVCMDSTIIMAAQTGSINGDINDHHGAAFSTDVWLVHLDTSGNILWEKSYGGTSSELVRSVKQTSDGGFIVAASSLSNDGDIDDHHGTNLYFDMWIFKTDSEGNIEWENLLGGSKSEVSKSVLETDDGFLIAGTTGSDNGDVTGLHSPDYNDVWIVKLNSSGELVWQKCLGGSSEDDVWELIPTSDGNFVFIGRTVSIDGDVSEMYGNSDVWIVKIDVDGNIIWENNYGGSLLDEGSGIIESADGFIFSSYTYSTDHDVTSIHGGADVWIGATDADGNLLWQKSFGGSYDEYPDNIIKSNSSYFIQTETSSISGDIISNFGFNDFWLIEIDATGNLLSQRNYGGTDYEWSHAMAGLGGNIYSTGSSRSNNYDITDDNEGGFDAVVFNLQGCIAPAPTVTSPAFEYNICQGADTTIHVDIDGDYTALVWKYNGFYTVGGDTAVLHFPHLNLGDTGYYICNVYYSCGVVASEIIQINMIEKPSANISPNGFIDACVGDAITLHSEYDSTYTYQWDDTGILIPGADGSNLIVTEDGSFQVIVTNAFGCSNTTIYAANIDFHAPDISMSASDSIFCNGDTITLNAESATAVLFNWLLDDVVIGGEYDPVLLTSDAGLYFATAFDAMGCTANSDTILLVNATPLAEILPEGDLNICLTGSVDLNANIETGYTYSWTQDGSLIAGETSAMYTATEAGAYFVTITSLEGCTDSSLTVNVIDSCNVGIQDIDGNIHFAIYPNPGDGNFIVETDIDPIQQDVFIHIFNSNGAEVFTSELNKNINDIQINELPKGIYIVVIRSGEKMSLEKLIVE